MAERYPLNESFLNLIEPSLIIIDKNRTMDLIFLEEDGLVFRFLLTNATPLIALNIRKIIMGKIPTMAIDCVSVIENQSIQQDEMLARTLSLIVFNSSNSDIYQISKGCTTFKDYYVEYELNVTGKNGTVTQVTSEDLIPVSEGTTIRPVLYNTPQGIAAIPIVKLLPGQTVHVKCLVKKNIGETHLKWSPVSTVGYNDASGKYEEQGNYIFTVETVGSLSPQMILTKVVEVYQNNN